MHRYSIGEFEEIVLLTVGVLYDQAYGVSVKEEIEKSLKRGVSVGALQSALKRLSDKGYLTSKEGEANSSRGGRPKLYYFLTPAGKEAIKETRSIRNQLFDKIPEIVLS